MTTTTAPPATRTAVAPTQATMTPNQDRRCRVLSWAALCLCILEGRPVTLLARPYTGPQLPLL